MTRSLPDGRASRPEIVASVGAATKSAARADAWAALGEAVNVVRRGGRLDMGLVGFARPGGADRDPHTATEASPDQPGDVRTRMVEIGVVSEADDAASLPPRTSRWTPRRTTPS